MSEFLEHRSPVAGRLKMTACAVAAALSLGLGAGSAALAQDATPAASTPAPTCNAPALVPGTPSTGATPGMGDMGMATPDAAATPEATPADEATGAEIAAAAQAIADCANAGDYEGLVALTTQHFLETTFGVSNPYDAVEGLKGQSQTFGDFKTSNPVTYADGSAGIDTTYMQTKFQAIAEHWTLVKDGDYWKIDATEMMTPITDLDSAVVGVDLAGAKDDKTGKYVYTITPARESTTASPALFFHARNLEEGAEDHELVVLQLPEGADPAGLFDGSLKASDITLIGQISVVAGTEQDMLLVGLPAGTYTMADFITGPDGVSHAQEGMIATFTVDPAS